MADENVVELNPKPQRAKPENPPAETPQKVSKRGRKPGVPAKERAPLPKSAFKIRKLTNEQSRANVKRKRQGRSDDQKAIDQMVYENWKEWIEAGKPMNWVDMPISEWPIPVGAFEDAIFMFNKACVLYGRKPIVGEIYEEIVEGEKCKVVPFCIITRPPKRQQRVAENNGE